MKEYPVVLSIAGSDSSGGAGIQADIKAMSAIGTFAATAITAITAQNTTGVSGIQGIDPQIVGQQIDAVFTDIHPKAVKIGMLFSKDIINTVAERLSYYKPEHIVLDPVMISTSGSKLIADDAIESMISQLVPLATVLTPNRFEAELLAGIKIDSYVQIEEAANRIIRLGCKSVLIKGGHFSNDEMTDYLFSENGLEATFPGKFVGTKNTHGTGCTLSSAIAAYLALGKPLNEAVSSAKSYLQAALENGADVSIGSGHGPLNHFLNPQKLIAR